jgi:hypothetical protein
MRAFQQHRAQIETASQNEIVILTQWMLAAVKANDLLCVPCKCSFSVPAVVQVLAVILTLSEAEWGRIPKNSTHPLPFESSNQ